MTVAISNMYSTFANSSIRYDAIGMNVNVVSYAANSTLINLKANGNSKFSVDVGGNVFASNIVAANINTIEIFVNGKTVEDIAKSRSVAMTIVFG